KAVTMAMNQMEGRLSKHIQQLRQQLLETIAHVEVNIDYPEYDDVEEMTHHMLIDKAYYVQQEIGKLLVTAKNGKILREGIATVIVGKPNVGKSSLLNSLVQEKKAIVTDIPGTTRDIIEEYINVKGIPLRLIDTAGIRETEDIVEKIGVERSREFLQKADLVLFVLNYNEAWTEEDDKLYHAIKEKDAIIIVNKTDLPKKLSQDKIDILSKEHQVIQTALIEEKGIEQLEEAISNLFLDGAIESTDMTYVSNTRHIHLLSQAEKTIKDAICAIEQDVPIDMVQIDITRAWEFLGEIIGDTIHDGLIDQLF